MLLQGKHKPIYVPNLNTGDYVVVVNAEKIRVTGNKLKQKMYYRHSGYHGGLKEQTLESLLDKTPTRALKHAVKGMLPKNTIGRRMLSRLKLYAGDSHPHEAQVRGSAQAQEAKPEPEKQPAEAKVQVAEPEPEKQPAEAKVQVAEPEPEKQPAEAEVQVAEPEPEKQSEEA